MKSESLEDKTEEKLTDEKIDEVFRKILIPGLGHEVIWKYGFNSDFDKRDRKNVPIREKLIEQVLVTAIHVGLYGTLATFGHTFYDLYVK